MSNPNLKFFASLDGTLTESVSGAALTVDGTPGYGSFADGSQGVAFDTNGQRVRRDLSPNLDADYGLISCRFKTLKAMVPADNIAYNLARVSGVSTGDFFSLELNYLTATNVFGPMLAIGSTRDGAIQARVTMPGLSFAEGDEHYLTAFWMRDLRNPTGFYSVFLAIDGRIVPTESNLTGNVCVFDPAIYLPQNLFRCMVGNQSATTNNPAQCIIQDVVYYLSEDPNGWQAERIRKLGTERFDVAALSDAAAYQPTYAVQNYHRETLDPAYNIKHWHDNGSANGLLLATNDTPGNQRNAIWYSVNQGDSFTKLGATPLGEGTDVIVRAVWVHQGFLFASARSATLNALYRAPLTLSSPTWTKVLEYTIQPPGTTGGHEVIGFWGHTQYENNLVIGEYEPQTAGGAKVYHSIDAGDSWTVRLTLPVAAVRHHVHAVEYDPDGRLWITTGDTADVIAFSDDHGATWTEVTGATDHSIDTMMQAVAIGFAPNLGRVVFASDQTNVPAQILIYQDEDVHPYDRGGRWSKKMFLSGPVGAPYNSNCFMVHRVPTGSWYAWTNNENSGTMALWALTANAEAMVPLEDIATNDGWGAVTTPDYVFFGKFRLSRSMQVVIPSSFSGTLTEGQPGMITVPSESGNTLYAKPVNSTEVAWGADTVEGVESQFDSNGIGSWVFDTVSDSGHLVYRQAGASPVFANDTLIGTLPADSIKQFKQVRRDILNTGLNRNRS